MTPDNYETPDLSDDDEAALDRAWAKLVPADGGDPADEPDDTSTAQGE